ncbi:MULTISPECIES: DUF881 domain-containing protein [unclassified Dehalobacter]|uniref:DUF881 domain-containing protein n=1 Tax=unclassified Dehalobacter TaxID=2635733 RepID=UPI000E6C17C3|nr:MULTISPECIES: DUF881 domain-containing protein [unclassified Dehalobacter]TCX49065.1 hypothetical protein C1I36_13500 [Dehalobacter sp. 14DCB1]TCX56614.1 hypothetical protein C1I38_00070 [Dehalobacter sp. 12DCB1]
MINKHVITVATIASVAIGFLISLQFQAQREMDSAKKIQQQRVEQTDTVMKTLQDENDSLQEEYNRISAELEKYKNKKSENPYLTARLDQLKIADGTITVSGPGVKMIVKDSGSDTDAVIPLSTDELREIVNVLRLAGAEAISINSQRIVASTSIVLSGTATILVNSVPISRIGGTTYEILAIGDQEVLVDYLTNMVAIDLKQFGRKVDITRETVTVPSYKGSYSLKYAIMAEAE